MVEKILKTRDIYSNKKEGHKDAYMDNRIRRKSDGKNKVKQQNYND